ncbi:hypothetical protein SDC9_99182 [bioreactor metagenome]|uniref:Uncharacterized protein n=1 Tax=bioreactor metagenome TaxID=1076179 RepID=A0A645ANJ4_9ZZZZ
MFFRQNKYIADIYKYIGEKIGAALNALHLFKLKFYFIPIGLIPLIFKLGIHAVDVRFVVVCQFRQNCLVMVFV